MKYAIFGAGSLGTVLGAFITKAGKEIDLINRNADHVKALNEKGAKVTGGIEMTVPVKALAPEDIRGGYDIVFLMTKQQQNEDAIRILTGCLSEDGLLVTLQNGIPEPCLEEALGRERVMGCTVEWGATLKAPGVCEFTSDPSPDKLSFQTGRPEAVPEEKFREAVSLLGLMGPVRISDNFAGVRWSKLLVNAAFAGVGTVMGGTFGEAAENREGQKIISRCVKECIDTAHAAGVKLTKVQGIDISGLFYYRNPLKKRFVELLLPLAMKKNGSIRPSMLQDIEKGKKCEVEYINGEVAKWGRKYGVPTPVNDRIIEVIGKEERGELPLSASNLRLFNDLV